MKRLCYYFLFFLVIGCVSKPNITVTDNIGRMMPSPSYSLRDNAGKIRAVFWYTFYKNVKDIDGSDVIMPVFLSRHGPNKIDISKVDKIILEVEIYNPNRIIYNMMETLYYIDVKKQLKVDGRPISISNLPFRIYKINIPLRSDIVSGKYGITVLEKGGTALVHVGDFDYIILNRKGGK